MIKTQNVSLKLSIIQSKGNIASDMDGEKVLMSIKNSKYYNLGKLGGVIWDIIETKISVTNLIAILLSEYDIEQSMCEEQVITFLELLNREGLIIIGDET
ncbi:PqqD family protein [Bacillus sp. AFS073361]|uniref:lasso peptide biosynthesis PqqD family chaperone n=1 Tax=Bacillus sp. AFS073361 TaxID=2033511 RepID=UPI000BF55A54|nr:lasso peptide biosynthesis PqqD family chaperone [Bacillus sp. AFS073361]PFP29482.1 PqqD family protein [Bacillus sp. AFS073361]